jgi:hypothetical protein
MFDPSTGKSKLMREFWSDDIDLSEPYMGKRVVVLTDPGSTRDTAVGTPSTIAKVKIINRLCRAISEKVVYSVNCDQKTANKRYKRVLRRRGFLHLDFKKFGLTFPRALMNKALQIIGEYFDLDLSDFLIEEFIICIGDESYSTSRGTALGWLDCLNSLCVCAILDDLINRGLDIDFVTFNDDVEIGVFENGDLTWTLEQTRATVCKQLDNFDIPISIKKTYGSRGSQFLERYSYYQENYDLDMYKEQLTVEAFATSLVTRWAWRAKLLFAGAYQWTRSEYAMNRCIDTCPIEFHPDEQGLPVICGGWFNMTSGKLDHSLEYLNRDWGMMVRLLKRWDPPQLTSKDKGTNLSKVATAVEKVYTRSHHPSIAREDYAKDRPTLLEINSDVEDSILTANAFIEMYGGRDERFQLRHIVLRKIVSSGKQPPPLENSSRWENASSD